MSGKFVIERARNGQFRFLLHAPGGEPILSSETYVTRASAEHGIASVRANAAIEAHYERRTDRAGAPYFSLKAGNHEIIGTSTAYGSALARELGIDSVRTNAPGAAVEDRSKATTPTPG